MSNLTEKQLGWELECYFKENGPKAKFKLRVPNPTDDQWTFRETAAGVRIRHPGIVIAKYREIIEREKEST